MVSLETRRVRVKFPGATDPVLKDISVKLVPGKIAGIIGPNGAGKSTLVRVLSRVLAPDQGTVFLGEKDLYRDCTARGSARNIAVVPQDTSVNFDFSVREVVEMGRAPHLPLRPFAQLTGKDHAIVEQSLQQAGVHELAERSIATLSGGERQRALLARALAQQTPILLLDEPTAFLDPRHQAEALGLVQELAHDSGKSVLVVLHDLNLAAHYCDRLLLMHNGMIAADGTPNDVLTSDQLAGVYGLKLWVSNHLMTGRPHLLPIPPRKSGVRQNARIVVLCGAGTGGRLLSCLYSAGYQAEIGPLQSSDPDAAVADALDCSYLPARPFCPFTAETIEEMMALTGHAHVVVLTDVPIGSDNLGLLQVAMEAAQRGQRVACLRRTERTFFDRGAAALWNQLTAAGACFFDAPEAVVAWIPEVLEYNTHSLLG